MFFPLHKVIKYSCKDSDKNWSFVDSPDITKHVLISNTSTALFNLTTRQRTRSNYVNATFSIFFYQFDVWTRVYFSTGNYFYLTLCNC